MKNMKLFLAGMLLSLFAISAFAQQDSLPMDQAISSSMSTLLMRLPEQTKVAILNFTAPNAAVSDYIIEELIAFIVNNSTHTVVDRQNLETLQREMNFQLSGEVDDTTAQSIGKKVGANTIVSGSLTPLGKGYRLRLRAINVETAE
ncbi:MAG: CsgG/HfaB family protein, partial [Treponema sp.]|nr:CsgG/HfaB family protein [Treponema sp.]